MSFTSKSEFVLCFLQIFGPVQSIFKFGTLDEVIDRANDSMYGLAAAIYSPNIDSINKVIQGLRAGTVW